MVVTLITYLKPSKTLTATLYVQQSHSSLIQENFHDVKVAILAGFAKGCAFLVVLYTRYRWALQVSMHRSHFVQGYIFPMKAVLASWNHTYPHVDVSFVVNEQLYNVGAPPLTGLVQQAGSGGNVDGIRISLVFEKIFHHLRK